VARQEKPESAWRYQKHKPGAKNPNDFATSLAYKTLERKVTPRGEINAGDCGSRK